MQIVWTLLAATAFIPIFHARKHKEPTKNENKDDANTSNEINAMCEHLDKTGHSKFTSNVLFYIAGYIVLMVMENTLVLHV